MEGTDIMDTGKIMAEVTRLMAATKRREDMRYELVSTWRRRSNLAVEVAQRDYDDADKEITAALASLRCLAKDKRFDAFSDDELLVAALKFASLYHQGQIVGFDSDSLGELICPGKPERLAALVAALFVQRNSPLNGCLNIEAEERANTFRLAPCPDKLNSLFVADNETN